MEAALENEAGWEFVRSRTDFKDKLLFSMFPLNEPRVFTSVLPLPVAVHEGGRRMSGGLKPRCCLGSQRTGEEGWSGGGIRKGRVSGGERGREGGHLGHVQDASSHQLSGQPIQPLVQAHPAAGVTALDVPAPPAAQLVEAQQLRHLLHRDGARDVLEKRQQTTQRDALCCVVLCDETLVPVCLQR